MVISWPAKIKPDTKPRSQFHHVNDIAVTIYDILNITLPDFYNGVAQDRLDGVSLAYTFNDADAKGQKRPNILKSWGVADSIKMVGLQVLLAPELLGIQWSLRWLDGTQIMMSGSFMI